MGDAVDFAVDFSTSVEKIADMKDKIKAYEDYSDLLIFILWV